MFRKLKVEIDIAKSTEEALKILENVHYDLIISDMDRNGDNAAGIKFLNALREEDKATPLIFYIGTYNPEKGVPSYVFGITNRPDELLHLALDALERYKY